MNFLFFIYRCLPSNQLKNEIPKEIGELVKLKEL